MSTSSSPTPRASRPIGVSILAILMLLLGIVLVLIGIFGLVLVIGSLIIPVTLSGFEVFGLAASLSFAVLLVLGIITLALAVGLWHQRQWALILAVIILLVEAAIGIYSFVEGGSKDYGLLTSPVIELLILIYLVAVRRHFH
jgi:uncharacterized membrane protein